MMTKMNGELKKVVNQVKTAQSKLQTILNNQNWMDEAKKFAEKQSKEVKKLLATDVSKVKVFIERERKELERFQKQIPGELKKLRQFALSQRKEFETLLVRLKKAGKTKPARKKTGARKRTSAKKAASNTSAAST